MSQAQTLEQRFWAKADRSGGDQACWEWKAAKSSGGYGTISVNGSTRTASRVAWSLANGKPFPSELLACHTCDNPSCVNPAHIWPGSPWENTADMRAKGRARSSGLRTYCRSGHPLVDGNLSYFRNRARGGKVERRCLTCRRAQQRAYDLKRRAGKLAEAA